MEFALPVRLFFDPHAEPKREKQVKSRVAEKPKKEKRLFCAACHYTVTRQEERISIQGGHEHTCTNPHGFVFHIGCFRNASGCTPVGGETTDHSWFSGYGWRIALCANCQAHLGWTFRSPTDSFHGLIINRLTSRANGVS